MSEAPSLRGTLERLFKRTERFHGPVAFLLGFGYDAATLRRIDKLTDNLFLLAYLVALGVMLVMERRLVWDRWVPAIVARHRRWVPLATQFLFGGLYSAYVIFYFKSANAGRSLVFLLLLVLLMVVNEFRDKWLGFEPVRVALYFFCTYSFLLFFFPVITGWVHPAWALPAMLIASLACIAVVVGIHVQLAQDRDPPPLPEDLATAAVDPLLASDGETRRPTPKRLTAPGWARTLGTHAAVWLTLWVSLGTLTCLGLIPPVPLSLQRIEVLHEVARDGTDFVGQREQRGWLERLSWFSTPRVSWVPGEGVVCFTAVFAPSGAELGLVHVWQQLVEGEGWVDRDEIEVEVVGGRGAGFRTWTRKRRMAPGSWRVRVRTGTGQELGWVRFDVESPAEGTQRRFAPVRL